jgi:hypothetical protein
MAPGTSQSRTWRAMPEVPPGRENTGKYSAAMKLIEV